MKKEQAATASAITAMGSDVRRLFTNVDVIEEEVGAAKKAAGGNKLSWWNRLRKQFRNMRRRYNRWKRIWQKNECWSRTS